MKKLIGIGIFLGVNAILSAYGATPASKEYVDAQIQKLQAQMSMFIGRYYQGGIVFWLDPTQSYQHGLIAAIVDQTGNPGSSGGLAWSEATTTTSALGDDPYQGENSATACASSACNTYKILHTSGTTYPAAQACASYTGGGYTDWYLPSLTELNLMWENKGSINQASLAQSGGAAMATANQANQNLFAYWSSTEVDGNASAAWVVSFLNGYQNSSNKSTTLLVRCIRAF